MAGRGHRSAGDQLSNAGSHAAETKAGPNIRDRPEDQGEEVSTSQMWPPYPLGQ